MNEHQGILFIAVGGLLLQLMVGVWVVVTINRLLRTQAVALGVMSALAARSGFKAQIDKVQAAIPTTKIRKEDLP